MNQTISIILISVIISMLIIALGYVLHYTAMLLDFALKKTEKLVAKIWYNNSKKNN